jgi:hypothetical protein
MAGRLEPRDQGRADEAGRPGDEHVHGTMIT